MVIGASGLDAFALWGAALGGRLGGVGGEDFAEELLDEAEEESDILEGEEGA